MSDYEKICEVENMVRNRTNAIIDNMGDIARFEVVNGERLETLRQQIVSLSIISKQIKQQCETVEMQRKTIEAEMNTIKDELNRLNVKIGEVIKRRE